MKKVFLILAALLFTAFSYGQPMPFYPVSYRIFNPLMINPGYTGSKDFFSADIIAGFQGDIYSQMGSANTRLSKKVPGYLLSAKSSEFTNFGVGGTVFNTIDDTTRASGIIGSFAYHIPVNKQSLTFLSIGASIKGTYYHKNSNEDLDKSSKDLIFPNADLGIYLYNPSFFAGISVTNLLGTNDSLTKYFVPLSRQYNFQAGVKIVVSRSLRLVVEPSLLINTDDSLSFNVKENLEPMLKVYAGNFCLGTYFNDYAKISFFFQYRFPRLYIGTFFALPKDKPYYKESPTTEIAVGINFSRNKSGFIKNSHW
jgi:type IX secretion system PorP/SprF family membrane protein